MPCLFFQEYRSCGGNYYICSAERLPSIHYKYAHSSKYYISTSKYTVMQVLKKNRFHWKQGDRNWPGIKKDLHFCKPLMTSNKLGWLMGLEPTTTGITIRDSTN